MLYIYKTTLFLIYYHSLQPTYGISHTMELKSVANKRCNFLAYIICVVYYIGPITRTSTVTNIGPIVLHMLDFSEALLSTCA